MVLFSLSNGIVTDKNSNLCLNGCRVSAIDNLITFQSLENVNAMLGIVTIGEN